MHKILAKLFGNAGTGVADKISGIVDRFVHTKDEKAQFIKEMDKMWINAEADMQICAPSSSSLFNCVYNFAYLC